MQLWQAVNKLDWVLIKLAAGLDKCAMNFLTGVVKDLKQAKCVIKLWEFLGCISDEYADYLLSSIDQLIEEIEMIQNP